MALIKAEWRRANPERERLRLIKKRRRERLQASIAVREAKSRPCSDCGKTFPFYVMDFDHVRGDKIGAVAEMRGSARVNRVLEEIAKCDLVCAVCH
jgi:hypothetical protein